MFKLKLTFKDGFVHEQNDTFPDIDKSEIFRGLQNGFKNNAAIEFESNGQVSSYTHNDLKSIEVIFLD